MGNDLKGEDEANTTLGTSVPKQFADRILSSRASLEGERKQVTVLFCDLAGFTNLSEKLDPEEVRDLIKPGLDIMASEVHAYEGMVAQFMGDGLMALFGAPLAHEDDPQRAIYASLAMQRRLEEYAERLKPEGVELSMRIGINTGLVIVGSVGDDLSMEYTALGDTVNLASRMESASEPGTVQVSESTYRLTEGYFDFSDLGEISVKGKEEPVHAYRVLGALPARGRVAASLSRGLSPFVGRGKELDQLSDRLQQVQQGQGQVLSIVGEPGVGKSRLLLQFRDLLQEGECTYLEGGCIHYGEAIAYLPILGILRSYFDIREGEEGTKSKQKMGQKLAFLNGQLSDILPPLQELLSLEVEDKAYLSLDHAQRREQVFEAIRYLLMAESQKRPLILAIEDLHWIDKTTEEFLSYFIEGMPAASILFLLLHRPEYKADWSNKTFYSQIRVDHLAQQPSTELVQAILSEGEVSPEISEFIVIRTAGNPLFIEELTRGLLEAGSILKDNEHYVLAEKQSDIQVPQTIQGIIASRLDRLPEDLKKTVQVASVIGREFSLRLLQEVTGASSPLKSSLMQLQSLEFIYEKSLFPEPEYIFKHALTQDVAYNSLLLKHRREMHARIGQAIERLSPDNLNDFYETLAYHYSHSDNNAKALCYLKLSGNKAARNYSNREAMRFYQEAIQLMNTVPESGDNRYEKMALHLSILNPLLFLGFPEGSLQFLREAERLAEELGDDDSLAAVFSKLSHYHAMKGNLTLGMDYCERCFDVAERAGDVESMATTIMDIGAAMLYTGRLLELAAMSRRVIELLEEQHKERGLFSGGRNVFANQCGSYGLALAILGELEEGKAALEKGVRFALEVDDAYGVGWLEFYHSLLSIFEGDVDGTIDYAYKAIKRFEEIGVEILLGQARSCLAIGYFFLGEHEAATVHAEKGLEMMKRSGFAVMVPFAQYVLALIRSAAGDLAGGMEIAGEAVKLSREFGARLYESMALTMLGRITGEADPSQIEVAVGYIREGIALSEEIRFKTVSALGYMFMGEVFELAGSRVAARDNMERAREMFHEIAVTPRSYWLNRIREALARLDQ